MTFPPKNLSIAILLATFNGAPNLREQLDSYAAQTQPAARLIVSDDGSRDETLAILADFAARHPELPLTLINGPHQGAAHNFLQLLRAVPPEIDMVAISDQDDVWLPEKLAHGAQALAAEDPGLPTLFGGRSWVCDAQLGKRSLSSLPLRAPGFCHALVQNIAGGNTMMLNRAALDVLRPASIEPRRLVAHDWWIYQIITGIGGRVLFDPVPLLLYRQHGGNLIGANHGLAAKYRRLKLLLNGRFRHWNSVNIKALNASAHRLTPQNRQILANFEQLRHGGMIQRLRLLKRIGLYRQGLQGSLSLWLAAVLGKI